MPKASTHKAVVFVIGGPGSGRRTQCEKIANTLGWANLASGDLILEEIKSGSDRGKRIEKIVKRGGLVTLDDTLTLLNDAIKKKGDVSGYVVAGFPREIEQATRFEAEVAKCCCVIYLEVSDETMKARARRGNDDDDTVNKRIETFKTTRDAIISHFGNKVKTVNAEAPVDDVFAEIANLMVNF